MSSSVVEAHQGNPPFLVVTGVPSTVPRRPVSSSIAVHGLLGTLSVLHASSRIPILSQGDGQATIARPPKEEWVTFPMAHARTKRVDRFPHAQAARSNRSDAHASPLANARRARKKASACSPRLRRDSIFSI